MSDPFTGNPRPLMMTIIAKYAKTCYVVLLMLIGTMAIAQQPCGTSRKAVAQWPQFRFDLCHSGFNPTELILSPTNVGNLVLDWSYTTGEGVFSSPAVANGVVYFGGEGGNVDAVNASTGDLLWSYATGEVVASSPAVANGVVYIGSGDGHVYALNASTGFELWSGGTGGAVNSSPTVVNGAVYVGSEDRHVYAFHLPSGN